MKNKVGCLISFFIFLYTSNTWCQYENVWAFGNHAGLDFNNGTPQPLYTSINTQEGCASVCDESGGLLFYTDGSTIWDHNNNIMANSDLSSNGSNSCSQAALIVPMPDSSNKFYVFSLISGSGINNPNDGKLYYSVIDMDLNNGSGAVDPDRKDIFLDSNLTEQMTGVPGGHCNIWLLVVSKEDSLKAYSIDNIGIDSIPVLSPIQSGSDLLYHGLIGCMDVSPDHTKLAVANSALALYDFDKYTGVASNRITLSFYPSSGGPTGYYGACFSPDNSKLYAGLDSSGVNVLNQFNLSVYDSTIIVNSKTQLTVIITNPIGTIKRAPDNKIYISVGAIQQQNWLNAINFPNLAGAACQYTFQAVNLGNNNTIFGLPNVVPVITRDTFYSNKVLPCFDTSYFLSGAEEGWDFIWNDGFQGPSRTVIEPGIYWVSYKIPSCSFRIDTFIMPGSLMPFTGTVPTGCMGATNGAIWIHPALHDATFYNYIWLNANSDTLQITMHSLTGDTLSGLGPGTYTVIMNGKNGCDTSFIFDLAASNYEASFKTDSFICMGDTLIIQNTSQGDFVSYHWDFGDGNASDSLNQKHVYNHAGRYTVKLTAQTLYPCYNTFSKIIIVDSLSSVFFVADRTGICTGQAIQFKPFADPTTVNIRWYFGDTDQVSGPDEITKHAYDKTGVMNVQLTAHFRACPDVSFNDTVYVYPLPIVNLGPDSFLCLNGNPIVLSNFADNDSGTLRYQWNTGETTKNITVRHHGDYNLTLTNEHGCSTMETIKVNKDCYIDFPNAFTPNGDGVNDYFFPRQLLSRNVTKFKIQVLNRWGQIIFETTRTDGRGWDGKLNGKDQPQGVYVYLMDVELDGHLPEHYQGNVTLIR